MNPGNYKTTLAAVAVVGLAVCFKQGWIDQETVILAGMAATALGLGFSKDHDATGGTRRVDKDKDSKP